jgi:membrane dipeptidase
MQNRKEFLLNALSIASGTALFGFKALDNAAIPGTLSSPFLFDLHCHPGRLFATGRPGFGEQISAEKTISEMNGAHVSAAFFSLVADAKIIAPGPTGISITRKYNPGEAWEEYKKQLKGMKDLFSQASVNIATKANELTTAGTVAAYIAVEGGDFLEGQVEKLEEAYQDGVCSVQLVHYVPNDLGDLQTAESMHNGLSIFGKEVVRKMNALGMLIDVAHASYQTTKDVADLTQSPIMLSHGILEMEAGRPAAKRAISKDHAKLIAATGGLIGAWPSGFNKNFDEFVENTLRLADVIGIDHVGIGTDMDANFKPVLSTYTQYPLFADALIKKGLSQKETAKIMGGNAARLLKKVLKNN